MWASVWGSVAAVAEMTFALSVEGYKTVELTEEQKQRRQQRAKKRRQQAHEKREKDKVQ